MCWLAVELTLPLVLIALVHGNVISHYALESITSDDDFNYESYMAKRNIEDIERRGTKACTDILSAKQCGELKQMASNVNLPEKAVGESLKEASMEGAVKPGDILKKAIAYLEERTTCDLIMDEEKCNFLATCASQHDIIYEQLNKILNDLAIEHNVSDVNKIYAQAIEFIENHHDTPMSKRHAC